MEMMDDFTITNGSTHQYPNIHLHHHHQQVSQFSMDFLQTPISNPNLYHHGLTVPMFHQSLTLPTSEPCNKNNKSGGRKRKRCNHERASEGLKAGDVIHVRAKRGQATDSHSLAERVRRKKINEKLKSLHDIVPGCHKTMGMAVMLDVVTKYIQSLQNQIEFLSMKLLAASLFHDLNSSDMDAVQTMQGAANGAEAQEMERIMAEGYAGGAPYFSSSFPHESFQNQ